MRALALVIVLAGCRSESSSAPPSASPPSNAANPPAPPAAWEVPAGWKREVIPFPLEFAPTLKHRGVEELRFPPGMFDPAAPGYWSYAFAWRLDDPAALDAGALATELTAYFRGLVGAVDAKHRIGSLDPVTVTATADGDRFALTAHVIDAFRTFGPVDLVGWARRTPCGDGALWVIVLARAESHVRPRLDALAARARCGQPVTR